MSLDLVSAKNSKQIDGTQKTFPISEDFHEQLLSLAQPRKSFPVIHKMRDYYADSVFLFGELKELKIEIAKIGEKTTNKDAIVRLVKFIDEAIADTNNLYVSAD